MKSCDLSMATAREKVRVAHVLKSLPSISHAFSMGELSYTKVRSLTRVADVTNEKDLLDFALRHTAAQVADRCRELRVGTPESMPVAERAFANRFLECHHVHHWSAGGETSLDNLVLLCTKHHTLVHEGGFCIEKDFADEWYFVRPDGFAVPKVGYRTQDMVDADLGGPALTDPPRGGLLSMAEKYALEPASPSYRH